MIALKIALDVQMGFQWAFKIVRWWAPPDRIRQSVPSTRTGHGKGAVAQCRASRSRHGQVCRGGRAQATSWLQGSENKVLYVRHYRWHDQLQQQQFYVQADRRPDASSRVNGLAVSLCLVMRSPRLRVRRLRITPCSDVIKPISFDL